MPNLADVVGWARENGCMDKEKRERKRKKMELCTSDVSNKNKNKNSRAVHKPGTSINPPV
jgi:hypothetical protein